MLSIGRVCDLSNQVASRMVTCRATLCFFFLLLLVFEFVVIAHSTVLDILYRLSVIYTCTHTHTQTQMHAHLVSNSQIGFLSIYSCFFFSALVDDDFFPSEIVELVYYFNYTIPKTHVQK